MSDQRLFIRFEDGKIIGNPITEKNMGLAFPRIDLNNLPENFKEFVRVPIPMPDEGMRIIACQGSYVFDGTIVKDHWEIEQEELPPLPPMGNIDGNIDFSGNIDE